MVPSEVQTPIILDQPDKTLSIFQENTLIGYSAPFVETRVLGQMWGSGSDLIRGLVRDKYPEMAIGLEELGICESGLDNSKCGDNGTSCGWLMFKKETFYMFCGGYWLGIEDQLDCGVKMIKMGLGPKSIGWYNCWRLENLDRYF